MSILINLLPDLRQAKALERKRKQLATGISIVIWVVCGVLLVAMGLYNAGQKLVISKTSSSINTTKDQLQKTAGLLDALSAEYDLESLPVLYSQRVYFSKFFTAYSAADPTTITVNSVSVDATRILVASGTARTYADVAKLARAMQASNITVGTNSSPSNTPYFSNVTLSNLSSATAGNGVTFKITAQVGSGVISGSN
jgi:hypothetical protein